MSKAEDNTDDLRLGMIVEPSSVEARIGLARLHNHVLNLANKDGQPATISNLAETEYQEAAKQILIAITQIAKASQTVTDKVPGWKLVQEAATEAVHANVDKSMATTPAAVNGSEIAPMLVPAP